MYAAVVFRAVIEAYQRHYTLRYAYTDMKRDHTAL